MPMGTLFFKRFFHREATKSREEELRGLIEPEMECLQDEEKEMIKGIIELGNTMVHEIMVPRIDVVAANTKQPIDDIIEMITERGHSRIPIYEDTIDNVKGVLYVKDLLSYFGRNLGDIDLSKLIRPAYFVPETKKISKLLREFRKRKVHIAIVVDEYGGMSGIVSLEDILEEIVGEIQDEYDHEGEPIREVDERTFIIDARFSIDDLNEKLSLNLPEEEYDTIGGFVFNLFGRIPKKREKIEWGGVEFTIQGIKENKISRIKARLKEPKPEDK